MAEEAEVGTEKVEQREETKSKHESSHSVQVNPEPQQQQQQQQLQPPPENTDGKDVSLCIFAICYSNLIFLFV